ncbi:RhuM family protein [Pseudomonas parasichuanensis]|uniref:RhuM family protein n=1 Tax=Pseudomonas parasichuanensis TaxID=2892329 RepID=UPI001F394EBD|nr:RhuM family protein [Pseudomonas parasichuanensis]
MSTDTGLTNWHGEKVRKQDIVNAKNYLTAGELPVLGNMVEQYLVSFEVQAMRRTLMSMADWMKRLNGFPLNDRGILENAGWIAHDMAKGYAEFQYEQFNQQRHHEDANGAE